jgi:hypothetical protein
VWLNGAGWAALVAAGLAAGALSAVAGAPLPMALPAGVVVAWLVALTLDHVRWRNLTTGIGRGGLDEVTGAAIVARLKDLGIDAEYREVRCDEDDEPQRSIECRNRDAKTVRRVLDETLGGRP